jgi:hypothetical protein
VTVAFESSAPRVDASVAAVAEEEARGVITGPSVAARVAGSLRTMGIARSSADSRSLGQNG